MSYINRKCKAFLAGENKVIVPVRSEARLKNYFSATDARAWSDIVEDRRQHILEHSAKNKDGFCIDKYVPLEILFKAMMGGRNTDMKLLQKKLDCLEKIVHLYSQIELPEPQKSQLFKLRSEIQRNYGILFADAETNGNLESNVKSTPKRDSSASCRNKTHIGEMNDLKSTIKREGRRSTATDIDKFNENKGIETTPDTTCRSTDVDKMNENRGIETTPCNNDTRFTNTEASCYEHKLMGTDELQCTSNRSTTCDIMSPYAMDYKSECMKREIDKLKFKCKETELLKLERDRLQINCNELSQIQCEYDNLRLKCSRLESAAHKTVTFKQKYNGLCKEIQCNILGLQADVLKDMENERDVLAKQICDMEQCLCEKDEEIKMLETQADNMKCNKNETESRMRDALSAMRDEVEKKNQIIAASEEKLVAVQDQLMNSIKGVSCKTKCLKSRIKELTKKLEGALTENDDLKKQVKDNNVSLKGAMQLVKYEYESLSVMKRELEAAESENQQLQQIANKMVALTTDEEVKKVLKQSECAIKRAVEELGNQCREWNSLRCNKKRDDVAGDGIKVLRSRCKTKIVVNSKSSECSEQLLKELNVIQREKEILERLVEQIKQDDFLNQQDLIYSFKNSLCKFTRLVTEAGET